MVFLLPVCAASLGAFRVREKLFQRNFKALRSMLIYATEQKILRTQVIVDVDALWVM